MSYFAKLKKGESYQVMGAGFVKDKEIEVNEDLFNYLKDNKQFEVREGEAQAPTDKALKDMTKAELVAVAKELELNGYSDMKKDELVEAIEQARAE